ncbi:hypothetical protein CBR_g3426 [Chara braunii]|uniref:Integrase catalytic domain-containing protein n=1 Tax=Chara braunii TaxID=69332 RepID=A0A388JR48_CHABU|nr:hypothetical protein CBR_g3426 [Chara braunii]|eukprot:GBG60182.1 hypothetical protein CBR_g3426 [Chara braunii]
MVDLRSGKSTSPYTPEQQEKMAALVRENKERKELEKQAKLKAIAEEQAAKMKRLEEEMKGVQQEEEERRKAAEEEAAAEEEKKRKRIEGGEGSSGTKRDTDAEMEKRISEWVANLSLGEDEEAESYVTQDERDALASELAAMEDPMERREREEEQKLAWKLRMKREKKRRREEVNKLTAEVAKVQDCRKEVQAQTGDKAKWDKVLGIEIEPGSRTPKGAIYRMPPRELEELRKQLDELLEKGWIRPSSSPFGARVLFVPKKEGELRMCINYRGLNAVTVKNVEPLPRIDDLLDRVQGCKYFSKIDLKSGYHQIEVHPDDQYKTAFRTRYGHYEFIVMPFGLTNAPETFQRCMNDLFRPWLDKFVVVYLDDILVFSKTLQEHEGHLRQVLEKLRESNFKINAKKCEWAKTQVLYLGHVLDGDGIKPEDSKRAAIRDWPTPRKLTELRSFLGLANYYRKFVRNFSTITAPLRRLRKKEAIWQWDKDCTSALKRLKCTLIEYPVLKVADPSLPFVVTMDASQYGIAYVLQQDDGNGYRPVEFMSARMPSEKVATLTYERELYALRQALEHWKHYLLGRHFKVYSDHETLRWLKTQAKMTPKLTRWAAEIDQYDFELKPVKGKYNVVADALSRRSDYFGAIVHYLDIGRDLQEKVKQAYAQDPIYSDLLKRVSEALETKPDYRTTEGLLFEKTNVFDRLCVPNSEEIRSLILGECHNTEGHFGRQNTLANLMRAYTWPGIKNDCIEYVRSCKVCQRNKTTTRVPLGLLRPLPIPDQPGDSVSIDFMDTQVKSRHGKSQVMVIVDRFSKYAVFVPLPAEARTDLVIQKFFDFWVSENGIPLAIVSDSNRDSHFTSQNWQELVRVYGSKLLMSFGHHPETNGQTEQMNKILQQVLRMYIRPDQINWDEILPKVASAYNNSVHLSTCRTPNELHKSFRPRRPFEGLNRDQIHRLPPSTGEFAIQHEKELATVVENLRKAQHRMIEQANKQFQVGDLVWVKAKEFAPEEKILQKLLPACRGPWPVLEVKGGEDGPSYTVETPAHLHTYPVFHASKLLPCVTSQQFPSRRSMIPPDMDGSYDIDGIVDEDVFRTGGRGRPQKQYKVRFTYQEPEDDRWFTRTDLLETAPDIVRAFERDKKGKVPQVEWSMAGACIGSATWHLTSGTQRRSGWESRLSRSADRTVDKASVTSLRGAMLSWRSLSSTPSHVTSDRLLAHRGESEAEVVLGDGACRHSPSMLEQRTRVAPTVEPGLRRAMCSACSATWQRWRLPQGETAPKATAGRALSVPFPASAKAHGSRQSTGTEAWEWGGLRRRSRGEKESRFGATCGSTFGSAGKRRETAAASSLGRTNHLDESEADRDDNAVETTHVSLSSSFESHVESVMAKEGDKEERMTSNSQQPTRSWKVAMVAAATVSFGVLNRVTFKLALVPMQHYPFFMAQILTLAYVAVYFSVLCARKKAGAVTNAMLSLPKTPFAMMGFLEAMGLVLSMAAGAVLSGAVIPILNQAFLVWQLALSRVFLSRRYSLGQLFGCVLVILGVVQVASSGGGSTATEHSLQAAGLLWALLLVLSTAFPAASSILKEKVFKEVPSKLNGQSLDLFVVNSFGSGFQAMFVFLLMPLLASFKGIRFSDLPSYLVNGGACFLNYASSSPSSCAGAPWLPLLYIASNLSFNILALQLLRMSSAVVASLAVAVSVPLSAAIFTLPLPLLGEPEPLSPSFILGAAVLVLGLLLYRSHGQCDQDIGTQEGELHLCVDYRGLTVVIVKNVEPLPRIDDLHNQLQGCKYFSKIDMKSGYHQIEVEPAGALLGALRPVRLGVFIRHVREDGGGHGGMMVRSGQRPTAGLRLRFIWTCIVDKCLHDLGPLQSALMDRMYHVVDSMTQLAIRVLPKRDESERLDRLVSTFRRTYGGIRKNNNYVVSGQQVSTFRRTYGGIRKNNNYVVSGQQVKRKLEQRINYCWLNRYVDLGPLPY